MGTKKFLVVALAGVLVAVVCLALATVLDASILYLPALVAIAGILIARAGWLWAGDWRGWLAMFGALMAVIALSAVVEHLS